MILETFPVGPLQCNCTLLADEETREAIIVDPGDEISRIHRRLTTLNLTLKQILDKLAELTGLPSPSMKVPHAVAMGFAAFDQFFTGIVRGKEPRATMDAVKMGRKKMFASSAKAERELGYRIVSVDAALRRAVEWFCANHYAEPVREMAVARV